MATLEELESQVKELQELVAADYTIPEGPEFSYPAVGQAVDDEMWKFITLGVGSGILDQGGRPYNLTGLGSDSATNQANQMLLTVSTLTGTAQAILKGFYHRLLQDMRLDFPMPLTETTYYVVLELNPLKARTPEGPISVQVYPNELNAESGREHLVLWSVTRKPNQLLTDAVVSRSNPRVAPTQLVASESQLPDPSKCLWGAMYFIHETAETVIAVGSTQEAGGPTRWLNLTSPEWTESTSGAFPWAGHGARPSFRIVGDKVELRGRASRSNGADFVTSSDYQIISNIPAASFQQKFVGGASRNGGALTVETDHSGFIRFKVTAGSPWVDLTGLYFYLR